MKPTVINNGNNSENTNPNVPQTHSNNVQSDTNNNTNRINNDPREFPSPFSARGFGFDDSDDDMFSDMGLRSRMNRMGHPFDWGVRKRRGSTGVTEPHANAYDPYFPDEPDFAGFTPPHWDTFNTARKRNQPPPTDRHTDRSGFFDYLPPEFRQYIPDDFGFSSRRQHPQMRTRSPPSAAFQKPPHPHQYAHPEQQYQPQQQAVPTSPKPNLCDAAIQTEDIDKTESQPNNLKQHGLRNTVDLGQKSQQEEVRTDRAHSAPPREDLLAQQQIINPQTDGAGASNIAQDTFGAATNSGFSNTGTSMTPQCNVQQPQFNATLYQQKLQQDEQQQQQQQRKQQQQRPSQQQYNTPPQSAGARSVPIFVEGRNVPLVNKINVPQQTSEPHQQRQHPPSQPNQTAKTQNRPGPFVAKEDVPQESNEESKIPPQTPHTTDCINKIQDIQRDVLDLMGKVERFGGLKGDKQYMYLDEMLTRNLLKLDTIDTNGKESIRQARKEAIKCIQASIAVMDAKSEINARSKENPNESDANVAANAEESSDNKTSKESEIEDSQKDDTPTVTEPAGQTTHISEIQINVGGTLNEENKKPEEENKKPEDENSRANEESKEVNENTNDESKDVGVGDGDVSKEQADIRT